MAKLTVVCGLPGSGKSHLVRAMQRENPALGVAVEDFMLRSIGNHSAMNCSRYYQLLISALQGGSDCVIADVVFVRAEKRHELERMVRAGLAGADVEWHWLAFAGDSAQCAANVWRDLRANDAESLIRCGNRVRTIGELLRVFSIQAGAEVRPVWSPDDALSRP